MDCKEFKTIVADLFDKDVDSQIKAECEKHISQCAECKEYYEELMMTAESLRPKHSPVLKREKTSGSIFYKVAAVFVGVVLLSGAAFATYRVFTENSGQDTTTTAPKMLQAWIAPSDSNRGNGIRVTWLKGTWVEKDDGSFMEERSVCASPYLFLTKYCRVTLNGKELDINNLPDLPASALKKVEIHRGEGFQSVNLVTTPVQIPADVKGNINPELTILLTGTPPKDSGAKTTIWSRRGLYDGFSWKNYTICSWAKSQTDGIHDLLAEVAIRKDHHVRINVCRSVPQKHIERIKTLMRDNGVTNYELINQE